MTAGMTTLACPLCASATRRDKGPPPKPGSFHLECRECGLCITVTVKSLDDAIARIRTRSLPSQRRGAHTAITVNAAPATAAAAAHDPDLDAKIQAALHPPRD